MCERERERTRERERERENERERESERVRELSSAAYEHGTETHANMYCRTAELSDNWRCGCDVSGVQLFAQRVY